LSTPLSSIFCNILQYATCVDTSKNMIDGLTFSPTFIKSTTGFGVQQLAHCTGLNKSWTCNVRPCTFDHCCLRALFACSPYYLSSIGWYYDFFHTRPFVNVTLKNHFLNIDNHVSNWQRFKPDPFPPSLTISRIGGYFYTNMC
jgi:hypothetical protein